jgi:hypothetical protein
VTASRAHRSFQSRGKSDPLQIILCVRTLPEIKECHGNYLHY